MPGGLSGVKNGALWGGGPGGGGQEQGLVCPGAEEQEAGGGLPLHLQPGPEEGTGASWTLGRGEREKK